MSMEWRENLDPYLSIYIGIKSKNIVRCEKLKVKIDKNNVMKSVSQHWGRHTERP